MQDTCNTAHLAFRFVIICSCSSGNVPSVCVSCACKYSGMASDKKKKCHLRRIYFLQFHCNISMCGVLHTGVLDQDILSYSWLFDNCTRRSCSYHFLALSLTPTVCFKSCWYGLEVTIAIGFFSSVIVCWEGGVSEVAAISFKFSFLDLFKLSVATFQHLWRIFPQVRVLNRWCEKLRDSFNSALLWAVVGQIKHASIKSLPL